MAPLGQNTFGYIAGLLDLKGNAYTSSDKSLVVYVNGVKSPQMQRDLIHWIGGGTIVESISEGDRRGCTIHCNHAHISFSRASVRYVVTGLRALCVLHTLEPSLFEWGNKFSGPYHEAVQRIEEISSKSEGMKILKGMADRGWEVP